MRQTYLTLFLLLPLLLTNASSAFAKPSQLTQKTTQLKRLEDRIQNLQQKLSNARDKRATLYVELKKSDIEIGQLSKQLNTLLPQLREKSRLIHDLKIKEKKYQAELAQQYKLIKNHIRAAYQLGNNQYLKLLLNQQSPNDLNRQLIYYNYFSQARYKIISQIKLTLHALLQNREEIQQQSSQLLGLVKQNQNKQHQLKVTQQYQQKIIHSLNEGIQNKSQRLAELNKDKNSLEQVIRRLQRKKHTSWANLSFHKMRQQLPWPTQGQISKHFGSVNPVSRLNYNGVFIRAPKNQKVRAIYPGKVVFANWLRGFGLLLIVDHGKGYMSLYAHNQSLYHKVGDMVAKNDLIAKVGNSGANNENGLYFEIRHNGKPLNPESWCNKLPS